jgi:hypothetical protein
MGCEMKDKLANTNDPALEVYRLRTLIIRTKEMLLASVHHLILGATVCDASGFPESARQMTELIGRLRQLADQLDDAVMPTGDD